MPRKRKPSSRKRLRRIAIRSDKKDEPDWDRFAWAVLQHARLLNQQRESNPIHDQPTDSRSP